MKTVMTALLIATTLVACSSKNEDAAAPQQKSEAAAASMPMAAGGETATASTNDAQSVPASAAASKVSGTVAETMNASGYTYVKIKTATGEQWVAIPETSVKKGAEIAVDVQMVAEKFESKTLKRTFDRIIFGTVSGAAAPAATGAMAAQLPAGHPAVGGAQAANPMGGKTMAGNPMGSPLEHMKGGAADVGEISVTRAEGANGKTVAEIWSTRQAMKDKPVVVRGKVVKFLPGIMGRNWIHLRDGSGSAAKGDNDITITTNESVKVGDVVLVTGVVRADKDFGAGYNYAVIVEDGKVSK